MKSKITALLLALSLSACATFTVDDLKKIIEARIGLENVAYMVIECVSGTPVEAAIANDFNYLIDLYEDTEDMEADKEAVKMVLGGRTTIYKAGDAWGNIRTTIQRSGLECNPRLKSEALKVEMVAADLVSVIEENVKVITALEWAELLGSMVGGPAGELVRLSAKTANQ